MLLRTGRTELLAELSIKNLGIIEDVTWHLKEGLNVITGETGAGKSLMIDAIEVLLSGKASDDAIRFGADEALVEGVFDLSQNPLENSLFQKSLFGSDDVLIINCRLRRKGAGIIKMNGHAATRSELIHRGRTLIDIHGQSDHFSLLNEKTHLDIIDAYGGTVGLRNEFSLKFKELRNLENELAELRKIDSDGARQQDFLRFQLNEITKSGAREGEEEDLLQEQKLLSSAERLKEATISIYRDLYEDESQQTTPVLDKLSGAIQAMRKLAEIDPALTAKLEYLEETMAGISETARDIHDYGSRLQYDAKRLEEIESRLETIRDIKRKYGPTVIQMIAFKERVQGDLDRIAGNKEKISELQEKIVLLRHQMENIAPQLSEKRVEAAKKLSAAVKQELADLDMGQMDFDVSLKQIPDPFPVGQICACDETGIDIAEFMASTNTGEPVKSLNKIASTGELSRFTLALKASLAGADNIPVLIFDEIDIGVGGRSGEIIGKKLWKLGRHHQVICVTHLPQISAFADAHFAVKKMESDSRTTSTLRCLEGEARINELAAMLGGVDYTGTSVKNAQEMVSKAEEWKQAQKF